MRRKLLPGPVLMGFAIDFDQAWGRPCQGPIPVITPTRLGGVLLPFPCVHCGEVREASVDPKQREGYRDPWREHFWCPACHGRYRLNSVGAPLAAAMLPGARCAPARVECGAAAFLIGVCGVPGSEIDLIEAEL